MHNCQQSQMIQKNPEAEFERGLFSNIELCTEKEYMNKCHFWVHINGSVFSIKTCY